MAEAAVGFVVGKLGDLIVQEATTLHGVRDQVEWLKTHLGRMQCFLKDADQKKSKGDDERVKNWVREMRDLAFETEDIIDTFMYLKLRKQQPGCMGFMNRYVFIVDDLVSRHKVHMEVEGIKAKLRELSESRTLYGIDNIGETIVTTSSQDVIPILPQLNDEIDIVGFDDEKEKIVLDLVDESNKNRSVISIVGMGGLGKTTLAKSIYNDPQVKRSFDIFGWVIISQEFTILEVLKRISSEVSATSSRDAIPDLSVAISEKLKKGKYLIVLDDVWKEDVWNELLKVFPNVSNGSRVIITTRFVNVAKIANPTTEPHELRFLDEKESRELFLRKAFPGQDFETCCPMYLVDSAGQIVERCSGLPLALVVVGGLMSTKQKSKDVWEEVAKSMKLQFVGGGEKCLEILALSYNDLPYYMKSCFLYFGCFREDDAIPAKPLIRLWSAEAFLPTKTGKTTYEIGMYCLEELAQRCLIQVTERKYDDSVKYCRIHDLLRDMCIAEGKENRFLEICKSDTALGDICIAEARRLIISDENKSPINSNSKLRGIFCEGSYSVLPLTGQFSRFKLLRVLRLRILGGSEFSIRKIKSLIHLRYLELWDDNVRQISSWIGHLRNLQTFIIRSSNLEKISDSLWRIDSLRHVSVYLWRIINTSNMGSIVPENLETLKYVVAGEWIGKLLPKLTNLRKLNIYLVSDDHAHDALSSALQKLVRLASLSIQGDKIPSYRVMKTFSEQHCLKKLYLRGQFNCKQLPHYDEFPQQLVKLVLVFSNLEQDPMPTLEKLQFLKYLELGPYSYIGKQMICLATGFPKLLSLVVENLEEFEEWKIEEKAMPCLKSLELCYCPMLKMIPEGLKNVPLDQLVLTSMPKELTDRIKQNTGEDWHKIQHVPNISIK